MATADEGHRPKYQQIADVLRDAILTGMYAPGDRLPGENNLMTEYGVARMTARHALGVLRAEGLAEARKGAGVFVRDFRPLRRHGTARLARARWGAGDSVWAADVEERSLVVDQISVTVERDSCVRRRRYLLDGKPVQLATSRLPMAVVAGSAILDEDTGPGGTYARLADLGHAPVHFREEIRWGAASQEDAERLGIAPGAPVFLARRTAYAEGGLPVEVTDMVLDANAYVLEYEFDA
ncbi:GntR family transcriptional regulator [Streptomyces sp. NPDC048281]|uniref:GntR family transcriptional regulator n=1 Tax=Streptomyces sp. NPDC048281 TaxID=3154715 RepID=UPI003420D6B8